RVWIHTSGPESASRFRPPWLRRYHTLSYLNNCIIDSFFPIHCIQASERTSKTILHAIAITISECIFALRCYAMWNGSRVIFAISCFTLTASITSLVVILGPFLPSVTFGEPPLPIIHGCYKTGANSTLFVCFVVIMISEAIIISLTLYRAHKHFHYAPNALIQRLTRDGVFYCLSVFAMSVTNVLVIFLLPIQYSELLNTYQAVMHTILASRMQLHLRKVDRHIHLAGPPIDVCLSPMSFSRSVGLPDV
ncbi:hypothetical protein BV22DRAFT_1032258, partial [Leucogyrophana mollusca]